MKERYNVSEIFTSIQGEGRNAGRPAVFLRFSFCNLWPSADKPSVTCPFCDTPQLHESDDLSHQAVISELVRARETKEHGLVITGGEPLMQLNPMFLRELIENFNWIDIETNGTHSLKPYDDLRFETSRKKLNFSCSPKTPKFDKSADQYKLLIPDKISLLPECMDLVGRENLYLQPVEPEAGLHSELYKDNLTKTIEAAHRTGCRVCLQQHKYLSVP